MGAGYDSRAYRFPKIFSDLKFFELDLPATIDDKENKILSIINSIPPQVKLISFDFNKQTIKDVLGKAGYDS